jgi:hypothetical protein
MATETFIPDLLALGADNQGGAHQNIESGACLGKAGRFHDSELIDKTLLSGGWSIGGLFLLVKKYFAAVLHRSP